MLIKNEILDLLATNIIEKMIKIAVLTAIEAPLYEEKSRKE